MARGPAPIPESYSSEEYATPQQPRPWATWNLGSPTAQAAAVQATTSSGATPSRAFWRGGLSSRPRIDAGTSPQVCFLRPRTAQPPVLFRCGSTARSSRQTPPGPWRQPEFPRTPVPSDGPLDPWPWLPRSSGLLSPTPSWTPRDAGFPTDRSPAPSRSHSSQPQEPGEPERLQPGPLPGRLGNSHLQPTYPQNPPGPSPSGLMYPAARGSPHPSGQP